MDIPSELISDKQSERASSCESDNINSMNKSSEISVPPTPATFSSESRDSRKSHDYDNKGEFKYKGPIVYDNVIIEQSEESSSPT